MVFRTRFISFPRTNHRHQMGAVIRLHHLFIIIINTIRSLTHVKSLSKQENKQKMRNVATRLDRPHPLHFEISFFLIYTFMFCTLF